MKVLTLNIGQAKFRDSFVTACVFESIKTDTVRSKYAYFVLDNGITTLFHRDVELVPSEYRYLFIRVAGRFALMTSLIAHYFKSNGVILSDDIYLDHTMNKEKLTQMLTFSLSGIPIPKSILFTIDGFTENKNFILKQVTFPCVLKTNGSQGRNVWKIEDVEQLEHRISSLPLRAEVAMIQRFVPNSFDIRALYMHGDVIGAIRRVSSDGFLNNVSAGGGVGKIELENDESELTKRVCKTIGISFAGVDIVRTPSGPIIFEVNFGPQVYGFESATGSNVPAELVNRIKRDFLS